MSGRHGRYVAALGGLTVLAILSGSALAAEEGQQAHPQHPAAPKIQDAQGQAQPAEHYSPPRNAGPGIQPVAAPNNSHTPGERQQSGDPEVQQDWFRRAWSDPGDTFNGIIAICTVILAFIGLWQAGIARDAARRQLRAYVGVSGKRVINPTPRVLANKVGQVVQHNNFEVIVHNAGQTPAYKLRSEISWHWMPFGHGLPRDFGFNDPQSPPPEGQEPVVCVKMLSPGKEADFLMNIPSERIGAALSKEEMLYIYGSVFYEDAFKRGRTTRFCYLWTPDPTGRDGFVDWDRHNDAD